MPLVYIRPKTDITLPREKPRFCTKSCTNFASVGEIRREKGKKREREKGREREREGRVREALVRGLNGEKKVEIFATNGYCIFRQCLRLVGQGGRRKGRGIEVREETVAVRK